jgi:hypothetical protein
MTSIASLLDEETKTRLATAVVADLKPEQPAKVHNHAFKRKDADTLACACGGEIKGKKYLAPKKPGDVPIVVTKRATDPNVDPTAPRRPRSSAEVDIDPESEALIEAACYFCGVDIEVEPKVPHEVLGTERLFTCSDCAKAEVRKAIRDQRNVETIHRTRVARHQPRTTDGINHPVATTTKEKPMIDLDNMTDAELGAMVRKQMKATLATKVAEAKPVVEAERAEAEVAKKVDVAEEQAQRPGRIYPGFTLKTKGGVKEVPALDLTDLSTLDEMPDAKTRSPYNKALSGLGEPILEKDGTTYATLVELHERLAGEAVAVPVEVVVAKAETTEKAKVSKKEIKALAAFLGISKDEAKARILAKRG